MSAASDETEHQMQLIAPAVTQEMLWAVGKIADAHNIPFHILGPMLVAVGHQLRQQHARRMVERGCTREQAASYLEQTRCEIIELSKGRNDA